MTQHSQTPRQVSVCLIIHTSSLSSQLSFLVVSSRKHDRRWVFPKGGIEQGEDAIQVRPCVQALPRWFQLMELSCRLERERHGRKVSTRTGRGGSWLMLHLHSWTNTRHSAPPLASPPPSRYPTPQALPSTPPFLSLFRPLHNLLVRIVLCHFSEGRVSRGLAGEGRERAEMGARVGSARGGDLLGAAKGRHEECDTSCQVALVLTRCIRVDCCNFRVRRLFGSAVGSCFVQLPSTDLRLTHTRFLELFRVDI
jgi:hypothetical protein